MFNVRSFIVAILAMMVAFAGMTSTAGASGSRGGGGGGKPVPVTLPADWPASVPVPAGSLQQTVGATPHWILQLVANGNYPDVMQAARQLYTSHGFIEPNPPTAPYSFENAGYRVTVVGAARDHSAAQTTVNIYLDKK